MSIDRRIVKLASIISEMGLSEVSRLILNLKTATPLDGYFPIGRGEPVRPNAEVINFESEDDDVENHINKDTTEIEKVNRPIGILRNNAGGRYGTDPEEDESNWFDALKLLGNNLILIPFDESEIINNSEIIKSIARIWGLKEGIKLSNLISKITVFDPFSYDKLGRLEVLKAVFPSLWSDISSLLSSKGIPEDKAIYMFYNQEKFGLDRFDGKFFQQAFARGPNYIGHDIGHMTYDFDDISDGFKSNLVSCLRKVLSFYKDEKNVSALKHINRVEKRKAKEDSDSLSDDEIINASENFFSGISDGSVLGNDVSGDVFAGLLSGKIKVIVPDTAYIGSFIDNYDDFMISESDKDAVRNILNECVSKLTKKYIEKNDDNHNNGGPLNHMEGHVVWF